MVSSPITSWQIDGETMGTARDFILGGSKIIADGDCSLEIKRCLLLGRKAMKKRQNSVLKGQTVSFVSPSICHEVMGWDTMIFVFRILSFKPTFSLFSFIFIKRFVTSSLSAIRMVSSAYLRLLIFLLTVLISACASSSLAFHMMYSAYKLNKQGDNK